jgi:hypothetical protein
MGTSEQPGLDEVEGRFVAILNGDLSRDEADRWAWRWMANENLVWDDVTWWALDLLHGIDLPAGPGGGFLHDDEQVDEWLQELRQRRLR